MSEPEQDWVGRAIPPVPGWAVHPVWHGLFTHATYASAAECFAANRTCRQDLVRQPVAHRNAVTKPDRESADTPDVRHRGACDIYPCSNSDDDLVSGAINGNHDDTGRGEVAEELPGDHADSGSREHLLLAGEHAHADTDTDVQAVRDPVAGGVLQEGVLT